MQLWKWTSERIDELDLGWIFSFQQLKKLVGCTACSEMPVQNIWGCYGSAQQMWRCGNTHHCTWSGPWKELKTPWEAQCAHAPGEVVGSGWSETSDQICSSTQIATPGDSAAGILL